MPRFTILAALVLMCVSGGESCGGSGGRRRRSSSSSPPPPPPPRRAPAPPPPPPTIRHAGFSNVDYCEKCEDWYWEQKADDIWRVNLNFELRCPCKAKFTPRGEVQPESHEPFATWTTDSACHPDDGMPFESAPTCTYHPGAHGCMRSTSTLWQTTRNARQQCCYDISGNILKPPHPGAGTPDKYRRLDRHIAGDVLPYNWCCRYCTRKCDLYLGRLGVRTGDASHCP